MKKFFVFIVIVISLCLCSCSTEEKIPTGYDSTYWGMSKDNVLDIISYVEYYDETETEISFKDSRVLDMRDYGIISLETFSPFGGGYQIPEITYVFEDDSLCEIKVEYTYKLQENTKWYDIMVESLESTYEKTFVSTPKENEVMRYEGTFFITDQGNTKIQVTTVEFKKTLTDYGNLSISYKPNSAE